jgi:hypothetical protein
MHAAEDPATGTIRKVSFRLPLFLLSIVAFPDRVNFGYSALGMNRGCAGLFLISRNPGRFRNFLIGTTLYYHPVPIRSQTERKNGDVYLLSEGRI